MKRVGLNGDRGWAGGGGSTALRRGLGWVVAGLGAVGASIGPVEAQEWTRFRGPNGSGLGTGATVPVEWAEGGHAWKTALPGVGHGSPVLWGDRVFVTSTEPEAGTFSALGVHADTGAVLWKRSFPQVKYGTHRNNTMATATAAVDEARVYVPRQDGGAYYLTAFDHGGKQVWELALGAYRTEHGSGHSPIVQGERVILAVDHDERGRIVAVDRHTGRVAWEAGRSGGRADYSTPCVMSRPGGGDWLVFNSQEDGITGLEASSGRVAWQTGQVLDKRSVSSPVVAGEWILGSCGSGGGGSYVVVLRCPEGWAAAPKVAYEVRKSAPYVPTPLVLGELLFLWSDAGIVSCLRLETGEMRWQERVGGNFFSSPVGVNRRLYGTSTAGEVVVLAAEGEFRLLARNRLGEEVHSTPAVARGRLYFRTRHHLLAVGG